MALDKYGSSLPSPLSSVPQQRDAQTGPSPPPEDVNRGQHHCGRRGRGEGEGGGGEEGRGEEGGTKKRGGVKERWDQERRSEEGKRREEPKRRGGREGGLKKRG